MTGVQRLAATNRPWGGLPLERSLVGVAQAGFDAIALAVHGVTDPLGGETTVREALRVGRLIGDHGLDLVFVSHEAAMERGDERALELLLRKLDHCALLGVDILVDVGCQAPEHFDRYLRMMGMAAQHAASLGVTIAMKSHGGISRTIEDTLATVRRIDHPSFRVCLDPGMLIHHAGDAALHDLAELAPFIAAVSARDHPGRRALIGERSDPRHDTPGAPPSVTPGAGVVDFAQIYRLLDQNGFDGPSAVETVKPSAVVAETEQFVADARRYLVDVMDTARGEGRGRGERAADYLKRPFPEARAAPLDCAALSRGRSERPLATAPHFGGYLLIEIAVPWPQTMGQPLADYRRTDDRIRGALRQAVGLARSNGIVVKQMAINPDPVYSRHGLTRVMRFDLDAGQPNRYRRWEYVVPDDLVAGLLSVLYSEDPRALGPHERWRQDDVGKRDLLICTHGAVDACCGTYGYPLYERLRDHLVENESTRVWRASSFGGHRFAPTLVDLPDGRYWGNLTARHIAPLLARSGDFAEVADVYRGSGALNHPIAQVAEAALFAHYGWSWTCRALRLRSIDDGLDENHARLLATVTTAHARSTRFVIDVDLVDEVDVTIGCTGLHGTAPVYEVSRLTEVAESDHGASVSARPLNLLTSVHSLRGGATAH